MHKAIVRGRVFALVAAVLCAAPSHAQQSSTKFEIIEATIGSIQAAISAKEITTVDVVKSYLTRIKAYNGRCVNEPEGILGRVAPMPGARSLNALMTLNLRPAARKEWGFDDRKARSMTDAADNSATMPDALELAAEQDRQFQATGKLVGPLHGTVVSIKDIIDTYDMRTTSGADADYANDRPPVDATVVKRLRDAGAFSPRRTSANMPPAAAAPLAAPCATPTTRCAIPAAQAAVRHPLWRPIW